MKGPCDIRLLTFFLAKQEITNIGRSGSLSTSDEEFWLHFPISQGPDHQFAQIEDGYRFLQSPFFHSIHHHRKAVRAGSPNVACPGLHGLLCAHPVDACSDLFLHPHAPPACSAAKAAGTIQIHLRQLEPGDRF
jgi:hypothetical protein